MSVFRPPEPLPLSALFLGLAGLVPFAAAAAGAWLPEFSSLSLSGGLTYGAVILSFLGGIRWGTAIGPYSPSRMAREFGLSVLPAIAGWISLLLPLLPGFCLLVAGFLLQALWDVTSVEKGRLPGWFGNLRMILTTGAVIAILAMIARLLI